MRNHDNPHAMIHVPGASHEGYHQFPGAEGDDGHGSVEVFYADKGLCRSAGWYWWPCFPGCLPDGEPSGPFATSKEAYDDAMEE